DLAQRPLRLTGIGMGQRPPWRRFDRDHPNEKKEKQKTQKDQGSPPTVREEEIRAKRGSDCARRRKKVEDVEGSARIVAGKVDCDAVDRPFTQAEADGGEEEEEQGLPPSGPEQKERKRRGEYAGPGDQDRPAA